MRSAEFSFCASHFAAVLVAPLSDSARQPFCRGIEVHEATLDVGHHDGVHRLLDGRDEPFPLGLDAPRLLNAHRERHEVVVIAREHRAHAGLRVDQFLQPPADRERDVLLVRAASTDGARVLAAVARIDGDGDAAAPR